MNHHLISFLKPQWVISFFIAMLSCTAQAQTDDQNLIAELEKQRSSAIVLGDEKALSDLLDDTFSGVTAAGKVINKSEQLTIYKSTNPYVVFTTENVAVNIYESIATVTGTLVSKSKSGSIMGKIRYLYIYLKSDGQWKIVNSQETVVIKE